MSKAMRGKIVCFIGAVEGRPGNNEYHTNDPLLVVNLVPQNDGRREFAAYDVFNFRTRTFNRVHENEIGTVMNDEYLENIRMWHHDQLKQYEKIEECMKDMEISEITGQQFMLWNLDKVYSKQGSSKKERLQVLNNVIKEITTA
jgi:hypothetical protein